MTFLATIKERYALTGPGSSKNTQHLTIDLAGSGLEYRAGDCVAVLPANDPATVERILDRLGASGDETVTDRRGEGPYSLLDFLKEQADLAQVNKSLLEMICAKRAGGVKQELIARLLEGGKERKQFQAEHHVWDLLAADRAAPIEPQELATTLSPLMPRFYSIASSQRFVGEEVHLTIANFRYMLGEVERRGVASHMLCERLPVGEPILPLRIYPTKHFLLPTDGDRPIIMIGPGTGIAPFRAFVQEREALGHTGKNWLFFGEWTQDQEFFYRSFWETQVNAGRLRLSTAFSRDQARKVYVQDRMWEERADLWGWLKEGAALYVCGNASHMAKDVEKKLLEIFADAGASDPRGYLKQLRLEGRYLRDVY